MLLNGFSRPAPHFWGFGKVGEGYWRAVSEALGAAVPSEGTCLMTMDPATLLPTAEFVENGMPADAISRRHREVRRPEGFSDELRVVVSSSTGTWGALTVFREKDRPYFSPAEVRLVTSLSGLLSDGLRRSLLLDDACADAGMLVLDPDDGVNLANQVASAWIDELGTGTRAGTTLPLVIRAVARQARAIGSQSSTGLARARVRTKAGRWVIVRASLMGEGVTAPVAVLLEAARPAEMAPLLADVYGLTPQERRVTECVAQGLPTRQIAGRLQMSAYTVQDHLKSIFAKTGTGSRGDLVARLFFHQRAMQLTAPPSIPDARSFQTT